MDRLPENKLPALRVMTMPADANQNGDIFGGWIMSHVDIAVGARGLGAAVIGGLGGFGIGVILAAALVPLIGVKALVPVLAVGSVIINAGCFCFYLAHVDRVALTVMLAGALPFLVLGAWLY